MTVTRYSALPHASSSTTSRQHLNPLSRGRQLVSHLRSRRVIVCCLAILALPLGLLVLALVTYLDPQGQSMKLCLPIQLHRISVSAHRLLACSPVPTISSSSSSSTSSTSSSGHYSTMSKPLENGENHLGRLAAFVQDQKEAFLADIKRGNAKGWHLVTGNEAGDLDSIASSVAYSFLSSTLHADRTVPLVLTPSKLMNLRPENLLAFDRASLPASTLLHPESLSIDTHDLVDAGVRFALVDHNSLLPMFGTDDSSVDAIVDHHDDEGAHLHAKTRLIRVPTGSCASLVTRLFMPAWKSSLATPSGSAGSPVPPELATLLLSAILIDTAGLKKGGKATDADYEAAAFLYPLSTIDGGNVSTFAGADVSVPSDLSAYFSDLSASKFDVGNLTTSELLMRDYKQYTWSTSSSKFPELEVGLSTVPLALKKQLEKEDDGCKSYLAALDGYMAERVLDIEGVLTTFKSENKGKSKRELLLVVRSGGAIPDVESANAVLETLSTGLEATGELLALGEWAEGKSGKKATFAAQAAQLLKNDKRNGQVWEQGNTHSTRKQVAPAMRDLIGELQ